MPNEAKDGVVWEVSLDREWVRGCLDNDYEGWSGKEEDLTAIMWAIFDHVQDAIEDFVQSNAECFLYDYAKDLGLPEPSDDD